MEGWKERECGRSELRLFPCQPAGQSLEVEMSESRRKCVCVRTIQLGCVGLRGVLCLLFPAYLCSLSCDSRQHGMA